MVVLRLASTPHNVIHPGGSSDVPLTSKSEFRPGTNYAVWSHRHILLFWNEVRVDNVTVSHIYTRECVMAENRPMRLTKQLGSKLFLISIIGYAILLSYTWPLGFAPIVSLQSLPVVLLGFALELILFQIFLGILIAPFSWLTNKELLQQLFNVGNGTQSKNKRANRISIDLPFLGLLKESIKVNGYILTMQTCLGLAAMLAFSIFAWYSIARNVTEPIILIPGFICFYWAYKSLAGLLFAKTKRDAVFPILGTTLIFIIIPTILLGSRTRPFGIGIGPNSIAQTALQIIGAGGEIPVVINPNSSDTSPNNKNDEFDSGKLIFFDGHRAWYIPCNSWDGSIMMRNVSSMYFPKHSICAKVVVTHK